MICAAIIVITRTYLWDHLALTVLLVPLVLEGLAVHLVQMVLLVQVHLVCRTSLVVHWDH